MKITIRNAFIMALTIAVGGCGKPVAENAARPEPDLKATPLPLATPTPAMVAITPTPVPNYFAPPGVFYTMVKISVTTDAGIFSLKPGEEVREIAPGKYRGHDHDFDLAPHQVTNDLRIASQTLGADTAAQAALRRQAAQWEAISAEQKAFPAPTPLPPGARVHSYTTTTIGPDGRSSERTYTTTTNTTYPPGTTYLPARRATPAPTPANALERGAHSRDRVFNRPFNIN